MIFKRTLAMILAGLLLGALLIGCGSSGEATGPGKKPQDKPMSPQARDHFHQGQKFLQEHNLAAALKEFQEVARLSPEVPQAHLWVGRVLLQQKDFPQAEQAFKKALELDPKNYQALAMLGKSYSFDQKKLNQAQEYLEKALEYSPDYPAAHFDLARLYLLKGERQKAFLEFSLVFAREPEFAMYRLEMGRLMEAIGEKKMAITHYQRAYLLNPKLDEARQAAARLEKGEVKPLPAKSKEQAPDKTPAAEKK